MPAAVTPRKPEPSEIEYKGLRFLITDRPSDASVEKYIEELKRYRCRDVVRVCEPTYQVNKLTEAGISVRDLPFDDGTGPPAEVIDQFFDLVRSRFQEDPEGCVAVHCVAGLGRAPVLVAIALIELGLKYEDAVELIRRKRHGAINARQLSYLEKYRPKSRLKIKNPDKGCTVM